MTYIVALGIGFKCPRKIHVNTWGGEGVPYVIYEWLLVVRRGVVPVYHDVAQIASIQKE